MTASTQSHNTGTPYEHCFQDQTTLYDLTRPNMQDNEAKRSDNNAYEFNAFQLLDIFLLFIGVIKNNLSCLLHWSITRWSKVTIELQHRKAYRVRK